jgi:hypothetical protein
MTPENVEQVIALSFKQCNCHPDFPYVHSKHCLYSQAAIAEKLGIFQVDVARIQQEYKKGKKR